MNIIAVAIYALLLLIVTFDFSNHSHGDNQVIYTAEDVVLPAASGSPCLLGPMEFPGNQRTQLVAGLVLPSDPLEKCNRGVVDRLEDAVGEPSDSQDDGVLHLPDTLDGDLWVDLPDGQRVGWRMLDAPPAPRIDRGHGAIYRTTSYDVIQEVGLGTMKESISVHRRMGVREWRWLLFTDGRDPEITPSGGVRIADRVVIHPPFIENEAGKRILNLNWQVKGNVLSLVVDDQNLPIPYVIDPSLDYPQILHLASDNSAILNGAAQLMPAAGATSDETRVPINQTGEVIFESMIQSTATPGGPISTANPSGGGSYGWIRDPLGGTNLNAGPWLVSTRIRGQALGPGTPRIRIRARAWKVTVAGGALTSATPLTGWSVAGPQSNLNTAGTTVTTTLNPTITTLTPEEHVYVEVALVIDNAAGAGGARAQLMTGHADSFVDFGGPAFNITPTPTNLRTTSPVDAMGWVSASSVTLRADLVDPDWYHHNRYQICADPSCSTIIAQGTSAPNQLLGSTNDAWASPTIPDGWYYIRTRTEEDGGDEDISPWSSINPDNSANICNTPNVGPCDKLGIDTTPPPATNEVRDGLGADEDWTTSSTTLQANWDAVTDPSPGSGLARYDYCFTTSSSGADCVSGAIVSWTSNGTNTSVSHSGLSLTHGSTYYACVRAIDNVGNMGGMTCSDGTAADFIPPNPPSPVSDGPGADVDWWTSSTSFQANWGSSTSPSGIANYFYCITTSSTGADCASGAIATWTANGLATSFTRAGLLLVEGETYHACVYAQANSGLVSTVSCSDGATLDSVAPPPSGEARDGLVFDIDWTTQNTELSANWDPVSDPTPGSGLSHYELCFSTDAGGADCAAGATSIWGSVAGTSNTRSGLMLSEGATYYAHVRAIDNAGNVGSISSSNGQTVDSVPPPATNEVRDGLGADIDLTNEDDVLRANWDPVVDPAPGSGLDRYEYCFSTDPNGLDCAGVSIVSWTSNATSTSVDHTGLSLTHAETYYACVRAMDVAGNIGDVECSDGVTVDTQPPPPPAPVNDGLGADIDWATDPGELSANWATVTDPSGIDRYEYCFSTDPNGADCDAGATISWVNNALFTSSTLTGLSLNEGTTYYSCARALDNAGNMGDLACSDGQTVDTIGPEAPDWVNDGLGADIDWNTSSSSISANWANAVDAVSGVSHYEVCVSTDPGGGDCDAGADMDWTASGGSTDGTWALTLTEGETYHVCVRAYDNAGNVGDVSCSTGQTVDSVPPDTPSWVNDGLGADIDYTNDDESLRANWSVESDPAPGSGVLGYEYCFSTNPSGMDCSSGATVEWTFTTDVSVDYSGLSLAHAETYYACVRTLDIAGNVSSVSCSDGVVVDTQPPPSPEPVNDGLGADIDWQASDEEISANWTAVSDPSGINRYEWCITLSDTGVDCGVGAVMTWVSTSLDTDATQSGLSLVDNETYHVCVRAFDNAGNVSSVACSDGVTVDITAPTAPTPVNDGLGIDQDWSTSNSQLSANWTASTDSGSGVSHHDLCFTTDPTGGDCAGGATSEWASTGLDTDDTRTGLTLIEGETYYACVRAFDNVGNESLTSCSSGQTVDSVPPTTPGWVNDGLGADIDYTNDDEALRANWASVSDPVPGSGVLGYEYCFSTDPTGADCSGAPTVPWTFTSDTDVEHGGLSLDHAQTYYACVRGLDYAGNVGDQACSDGVVVDTQPPPSPEPVNDGLGADIDWTASDDELSANWATVTDPSGINRYEYCFSTDSNGADCAISSVVIWSSSGLSTSITESGLALFDGITYYACARAFDNAGSSSDVACSDGQTVDTTPPDPPSWVNDGLGADIDWTTSSSELTANWSASFDGDSGMNRHELCFSTDPNGADCTTTSTSTWMSEGLTTSSVRSGLSLVEGETYYACVRGVDNVGNVGNETCSTGQSVDSVPPTTPGWVNDGLGVDIDYSNDDTQLSANWDTSVDATSGVDYYEYCFSLDPDGIDCSATATVSWTSSMTTSITHGGLALNHASTYYACVRAVDVAGNMSGVECSDGVTIDTQPPPPPAPVNDGLGADIDWQASDDELSANWATVTDPSGINRYEYCFTTEPDGSDCDTTSLIQWTSSGLLTSTSETGLTLVDGITHYACARAFDNAGSVSDVACSDGVTVDATPPPAPGWVNDGLGADIDWTTSNTSLSANWDDVIDTGSGLANYELCFSLDATGSDCSSGAVIDWSSTGPFSEATRSGLSLTEGETYYACVRAFDNVGNMGDTACSTGQTVDSIPPTTPGWINDGLGADIDYSNDDTQLSANWGTSADATSGIDRYEYCFSTDSVGLDCDSGATVEWEPTSGTGISHGGLSLNHAETYYACVRVYDVAGNASGTICSDGVTIDTQPPPAPEPVNDSLGADIDWQASDNELSANWATVTDPSGINRYEWCLTTDQLGSDCATGAVMTWTSTGLDIAATQAGLTLADSTTYYACARAFDNAGSESDVACSDGVTVDTIPPATSDWINDGLGADIAWTTSASELSANWDASFDSGSGLNRYELCFSTDSNGADCDSTATSSWTSEGLSTSGTRPGLTLVEGEIYYACTRAIDDVGNVGGVICSTGQSVDSVPPTSIDWINDGLGADIDWQADDSYLEANWDTSTDATSGIAGYEYCFSTDQDGTDCASGSVVEWTFTIGTSVSHSGLSLDHAQIYYACAKAVDIAGNRGDATCSDGVIVDTEPIDPPAWINDGLGADIDWTASDDELSANWDTVTTPSGIDRYELCFSTDPDGLDCVSGATSTWQSTNLDTNWTVGSLALIDGETYYACVRVFSGTAAISDTGCSDGVTVDTTPPPAPDWVNDGLSGPDQDWNTNSTSISSNWAGVSDSGSGLNRYELCFSTDSDGLDCVAGATVEWSTSGLDTSDSRTGLSLTEGQTYYSCVRGVDNVGNEGAWTCSTGQVVDSVPPTATSWVNDGLGADIDYSNDDTQLSANWDVSTDATSGVDYYEYCFSTDPDGVDCDLGAVVDWTVESTTNITHSGLALNHAETYYACVRATDVAGNIGDVSCSDGLTIDTQPPPAPEPVNDGLGSDIDWTASDDELSANWATVTDPSGINRYEWCLTTDQFGIDCSTTSLLSWTSVGLSTSGTETGMTLVDNTTYYACARAFDNAGSESDIACSDGVTVDTTPPAEPDWVNDGLGPDIDWTTDNSSLSANWDESVDTGSGVSHHELCFSTDPTGADCDSTATSSWLSEGMSLSATRSGLALAEGETYYACVRAMDNVGNMGASRCSDGQSVDSVPPTAPTWVNDGLGADIDYSNDDTQLSANWGTSTDATSGLDRYELCFSTDASGTDCLSGATVEWMSTGTDLFATVFSLVLDHAETYYACTRAFDVAGNVGDTTCSDGVTIDTQPPPAPEPVNDSLGPDIDWQASDSELSANWAAVTDPSGINRYEWCLTTDANGSDCAVSALMTWISTGLDTWGTETGLSLSEGVSYHACVRAFDNAGSNSDIACSDGVQVDTTPPDSPNWVNDGLGADIAWTTSNTELSANWDVIIDSGSGVDYYEVCFSTDPSGADCDTTATSLWSSSGTLTNETRSGLSLTEGETYYACARAIDNVGNIGDARCSTGQTVDSVPPTTPAWVNDGLGVDIDYTNDDTQLSANWDASTDATSGVESYEVCFSTDPSGDDCDTTATATWQSSGAATSFTATGLSLDHAETYYACVRAIDVAGNTGVSSCSDGVIVDTQPPPAPEPVNDGLGSDIDWVSSTTSLSGNWATVTDPIGIDRYEVCLTESPTGVDCSLTAITTWTSTGLTTEASIGGLSLTNGDTYYVCARAFDLGGNSSDVACSDGQTVDITPPPPPDWVNDGLGVDETWNTDGSYVSANWSDVVDSLSGLSHYAVCVSTSSAGTDCATGAAMPWIPVGGATSGTWEVSLVQGETYHVCVRAYDNAGNIGLRTCSSGQTVDSTPPTAPPWVNDGLGADIDYTNDDTSLSANWADATDAETGISGYEWCLTTSPSGSDCVAGAVMTWSWSGAGTSASEFGLSLVHATTYYACVRAIDLPGNIGPPTCSDGVTVNTEPPPPPEPVNDGPSADIDYQQSTTRIQANWASVTDPSGIDRYEWCITTSSTGTDCNGGAVVEWTSSNLDTSMDEDGLTLTSGQTYHVCARAFDGAGNAGGVACSDGVMIDDVPPTAPSWVNDGLGVDIDWSTSDDQLQANWDTSNDGKSGLLEYEACFSVDPAGADCELGAISPWTSTGLITSVSRSGLSLSEGQTYYACIRAIDNVENISSTICSDGQTVDSIPPTAPSWVNDGSGADIDITNEDTTYDANWGVSTDTTSGVASYEWCLTTSAMGSDCSVGALITWDNVGMSTSASASGLSLQHDTTYYACVRAIDVAENVGTYTCSDGLLVNTEPPPAPEPVLDGGSGGDLTWNGSDSDIAGRWQAVSDPTGIDRYEWCVSADPAGADCTVGAVITWADVGLNTSASETGLILVDGGTYYVCARAFDGAGNAGDMACSSGQTVDVTPPDVPAWVNDGTGADVDWTTSSSTLHANWATAVDSGSGVANYLWCLSTDPAGADCVSGSIMTWQSVPGTSGSRSSLALADGVTVYACARAVDVAGNVGNTTCSDGQTVDTTPPTRPDWVNDGPGVDIDFTNSDDTLEANWAASTDATSGVAGYEYCFTTNTNGNNCATTATVTWTPNATTDVSHAGLSMSHGETYYACVRAIDVAGNIGLRRCSDGQMVDTEPPSAPSFVRDSLGSDIDWQASDTEVSANWAEVTTSFGVDRYEWCLSTDSSGADCDTSAIFTWDGVGLSLNATRSGLTLTDGTTYYACARAVDSLGSLGNSACSDGVTVDTTPPPAPDWVNDGLGADIDWTSSNTTLRANWAGVVDSGSGVAAYFWCLTTDPDGIDCASGATMTWASIGLATSATRNLLSLAEAQTYYACVRAVDTVGNTGSHTCSDGVVVDTTPPTAPTPVNDGTGTDIDFQSETDRLDANWGPSTDATSGVAGYQACFTSSPGGAGCGGSALMTWTTPSMAMDVSLTGLSLPDASTWYACVRAIDNAGNVGSMNCSDGVVIDSGPPSSPAWINDGSGADVDWISSTSEFSANWGDSTAASGIDHYEWCVTLDPSGADCDTGAEHTWENTGADQTAQATGLTLADGDTVYACARATSGTMITGPHICSDGAQVKTSPPTMGQVRDGTGADIDFQASTSQLWANWDAAADPSGVSEYEVCFTTSSTAGDCAGAAVSPWASTALTLSASRVGLSMTHGTIYYACVRATDTPGNVSAPTCSDGVMVDTEGPTNVTAIFPADGSSVDEGTFTYDWSDGNDPAGVVRYDIWVNGTLRATNLTTSQWGTLDTHAGNHTWRVRAYDSVGNWTDFDFTFTADPVPDTTPPSPFNLVSPNNGATVEFGSILNWEAAYDFNGIDLYRVILNGTHVASLPGNITNYTLSSSSGGATVCLIDFDTTTNEPGCVSGINHTGEWTIGPHGGWNVSGNSLGLVNFDGETTMSSATMTVTVPTTGADIKFAHHHDNHATLDSDGGIHSAWDGGTIRISQDGGATWESMCNTTTTTTFDCVHKIVDGVNSYGHNGVTVGGTGSPLPHHAVWTGTNDQMQTTRIHLSKFAGQTILIQFSQLQDACHVGLPAQWLAYCPDGVQTASWYIDEIELVEPELAPGPHTWTIQAVDPSGNVRTASQTWGFVLDP